MSDPDPSFGASRRLKSAGEFARVFDQPTRASNRYFTLLARPNGGAASRLGLAIAKKHLRRAVDRNRVKRLVRESFRMHAAELPCVDMVVMARKDTMNASNAALRAALGALWRRIAAISS